MATRSAFKRYESAILQPIIGCLTDHLIKPVANLIVDYLNLPKTREDHFRIIVSSSLVLYGHCQSDYDRIAICVAPGRHFSGIDIVVGYIVSGSVRWFVKRGIDPPVQSVLGSANMFDEPIPLLARISVAMSYATPCEHVSWHGCNGRCIRDHAGMYPKKIVKELHRSYFNQVEKLIDLRLCKI